MNAEALDQRKRMPRVRMKQWHKRVRRWYSMTSNSSQMAVAPASTPPEIFLFLHRKRSAAASIDRKYRTATEIHANFQREGRISW